MLRLLLGDLLAQPARRLSTDGSLLPCVLCSVPASVQRSLALLVGCGHGVHVDSIQQQLRLLNKLLPAGQQLAVDLLGRPACLILLLPGSFVLQAGSFHIPLRGSLRRQRCPGGMVQRPAHRARHPILQLRSQDPRLLRQESAVHRSVLPVKRRCLLAQLPVARIRPSEVLLQGMNLLPQRSKFIETLHGFLRRAHLCRCVLRLRCRAGQLGSLGLVFRQRLQQLIRIPLQPLLLLRQPGCFCRCG